MLEPADKWTLIASLNSTTCLACGGKKNRAQTFCGKDYHALPALMKKSLYNRVGNGYEKAVADALEFLKATPHLPEASLFGDKKGAHHA